MNVINLLKDKVTAISTSDEIEKAVVKATSHQAIAPKTKHVWKLLRVVRGEEPPHSADEVWRYLKKRLEHKDWTIVLKSLVVFHHLLRETHSTFRSIVAKKSPLYFLSSYADHSSPESYDKSILVRAYAKYLEELVHFMRDDASLEELCMRVDVKSFRSSKECFEVIKKTQEIIEAILVCRVRETTFNSPVSCAALKLLIVDSCKISPLYNRLMLFLVDNYFRMDKPNARSALELYKSYDSVSEGLVQLFELGRTVIADYEVPAFRVPPRSVIRYLERYIAELETGKPPGTIPAMDLAELQSYAHASASTMRASATTNEPSAFPASSSSSSGRSGRSRSFRNNVDNNSSGGGGGGGGDGNDRGGGFGDSPSSGPIPKLTDLIPEEELRAAEKRGPQSSSSSSTSSSSLSVTHSNTSPNHTGGSTQPRRKASSAASSASSASAPFSPPPSSFSGSPMSSVLSPSSYAAAKVAASTPSDIDLFSADTPSISYSFNGPQPVMGGGGVGGGVGVAGVGGGPQLPTMAAAQAQAQAQAGVSYVQVMAPVLIPIHHTGPQYPQRSPVQAQPAQHELPSYGSPNAAWESIHPSGAAPGSQLNF